MGCLPAPTRAGLGRCLKPAIDTPGRNQDRSRRPWKAARQPTPASLGAGQGVRVADVLEIEPGWHIGCPGSLRHRQPAVNRACPAARHRVAATFLHPYASAICTGPMKIPRTALPVVLPWQPCSFRIPNSGWAIACLPKRFTKPTRLRAACRPRLPPALAKLGALCSPR